jgi:galactokinase/mevalonate kinase-like predicted kinase
MSIFMNAYCIYEGMALAGAGGGGFLYAITREKNCAEFLQNLINLSHLNMKLYNAQISIHGIQLSFA